MKIQRLFLLIVCISCIFTIHAQVKCFYYALTKKVQKGISSTNVSGGQFITFLNEVCYRRQTPPSSATTCSLIRKKGSSTGSSDNGGAVYTPSYPNYGNNGGNTSNPTRDGNNT